MNLRRLLHFFGHLWVRVGRKGANVYWECSECGARDWGQVLPWCVGPLDRDWLDGRVDALHRAEPRYRPPQGYRL